MQLNIIAAVSLNGVIGNRTTNSLPWGMTKYPEDMAFFRKVTSGEKSVVIMGSSTMKSIGRKLPKRRNIVISRTADLYKQEETGIETYSTVEEALLQCRED
jgi:dihydrofolate reductase